MARSRQWRVGLGADHIGADLKNALKGMLETHPAVSSVRDFGVPDAETEIAYPTVAVRVGEAVARGEIDRAILICGTGIGMAMSANKVRGVRAAVAYDFYSVERSVLSNNCQVLALGSKVIAPALAQRIVCQWLTYEFDDDAPSAAKVAVLTRYEEEHTAADHSMDCVPRLGRDEAACCEATLRKSRAQAGRTLNSRARAKETGSARARGTSRLGGLLDMPDVEQAHDPECRVTMPNRDQDRTHLRSEILRKGERRQ